MGIEIKKFFRACSIIGVAMVASLAHSAQIAEAEVTVPKGIKDIVALLEGASVNRKSREADIALIGQSAPTAGTDQDKYIFYYLQAQAAERLGRIDLRVGFLKKALEFAKEKTFQEFSPTLELAGAEIQAGNAQTAIERILAVRKKMPRNFMGLDISFTAGLSRIYAQTGDFEQSENYLRETDANLVNIRRGSNYMIFGYSWERNFFQAQGELAFQRGRFAEAEVAFRKAIQVFESGIAQHEKMFYSAGQGLGVPGLAGESSNSGNPNSAREAQELLYIRLSETLLKLQKINEAEFLARESLKKSLARTGKASLATSKGLRQLAIVLLARERNKDAVYLLQQSVLGLQEAGVTPESVNLAVTQKTLASALIADEQFAQALRIYAQLDATAKAYPDTARFVDTNSPDRVLALVRMGDFASAEKIAAHLVAINEARTGKNSKESTQAKLLLSVTYAMQQKDDSAKTLFASSMAELMEHERHVSADSDGISSRDKKYLAMYVESYLDVLSRFNAKTPSLKLVEESFVLGDFVRSGNVQRALSASTARANVSDPRLSKLVRQEQDLNQQILFLTKFSKELAMKPANEQLPQIQAKMKADIEQLRADAKRASHLISLDFPDYAELINPKPISLATIQKFIKPNETLITWFVGVKTTYVWAVNQKGLPTFKAVALGHKELKDSIAQLRKSLDPAVSTIDAIPDFDFQIAGKIYDQLFKPVEESFGGKDTLISVPHDDIGQLPLGVLTTEPFKLGAKSDSLFANYKEAPWLIRKFAIVNAPSVTALNSLRRLGESKKDRLDFIGFGDPFFSVDQAKAHERKNQKPAGDTQLATRGMPLQLRSSPKTSDVSSAEVSMLPSLPDTHDEILEISKVFDVKPERDIYLQKRASLDQVLKVDLSNRKVVMFSTHGLIPGELDGLTQPALALTNPEVHNLKGDGLLKVDTILTLKLDADWVVLSACNTAAAEGEGAEALSGLGRAFFFAGARALLVSSWPVDSEASRKLMTDLFKRYTQDKSTTKPRALQQASLGLMNDGVPDDQKSRYTYAHPLFWGPFTMVGN